MGKKNTFFDYEHYDETLDPSGDLDEYERRAATYEAVPDLEETDDEEDPFEETDESEEEQAPDVSTSIPTGSGNTSGRRRLSILEILTLDNYNDKSDYRINNDPSFFGEQISYETDSQNGNSYAYPIAYIKELMRIYHNGDDETKNHVIEEFLAMLTPLVKSTIRRLRGKDSEFDDYIQHCYMYIKMRIDKYDPEKSSPFNYFKYIIIEAISNYFDDSRGISGYYSSIDRKVRRIIRGYEASHLRITPSKIAQEAGITVRQAEDSLARIIGSKIQYEEDMTSHDSIHFDSVTPESVIVRQESESLLYLAIECLPYDEQTAILLSYGLTDDHIAYSNKAISQVLHCSESKVKELLSAAKRRLRNDYALNLLRGNSTRIIKRKDDFCDSDPSLYSFDPSCDEYIFLDEDDKVPSDLEQTEICDLKTITFTDYE